MKMLPAKFFLRNQANGIVWEMDSLNQIFNLDEIDFKNISITTFVLPPNLERVFSCVDLNKTKHTKFFKHQL